MIDKLKAGFRPPAFVDVHVQQAVRQIFKILHAAILVSLSVILLLIAIAPGKILLWAGFAALIVLASLVVRGIARRGRTRTAAVLLVLTLWLIITLFCLIEAGVGLRAAWGYFIVVYIAGLLLGRRAGILATAACSLSVLGIILVLPVFSSDPLRFWLVNSLYLLIVLLLQNMARSSIAMSTRQAQDEMRERLQTEAALAHSEQKYRDMVESQPFCIFETDLNGNATYANQTALEWFGYSRSEVAAGVAMRQILDEGDWERAQANFQSVLSGREIYPREYRMKRKDGSTFPVLLNTRPILKDGAAVGLQGSMIDISQRQQAEKERERVISLLRATLESTADGILVVDMAGKIAHFNRRFMEMWQLPETLMAEQMDMEELSFLADRLVDRRSTIFSRTEAPFIAPHQERMELLELRNGRFFEFYSRPQLLSGLTIGMVWSFSDISERKQAEMALQESELRYRSLFEAASDAILIMKGNHFYDCNSKALEMYGCSRGQIIGVSPDLFSPPFQPDGGSSREKALGLIAAAYAGQPQFFVWIHCRADQTLFTAEVSLNRIEISGEAYLLSIVRDITDRRRLEEQLLQAQKMEAIGILAGGVAHDFNNILSTIVGYGSLLQLKLKEQKGLNDYIERILSSCERAVSLTSSLLTFSRKQEVELQPVEINRVISLFHKMLSRLISENIEFGLHLQEQSLVVEVDVRQFEQVLMNLVTNGRDAMPNGGRLTIATEALQLPEPSGEIPAGAYALISISDSGSGIEPRALPHIFEPFFTTKAAGRGTGLGMAIVYGIIKKHNGFITVASAVGMGTTFRIFLPLKSLAPKEPVRKKDETLLHGSETVLLIEDDATVRHVIRSILQEFGYRVIEAVDGDEAVRIFSRSPDHVHVVLSDLVMPKKNGWEVAAEIRRLDPHVKILYMSGYETDFLARQGNPDPAAPLLLKPIQPLELLTRLRQTIDS